MARPIEMLLAGGMLDGRRILSPAGVAALTTGAAPTGVGDARYAMGWVDATHDGLRTVAHAGSTTDMAAVAGHGPGVARCRRRPRQRPVDPVRAPRQDRHDRASAPLDRMVGGQSDGTLERFYPIVDVVLVVLLAMMLRGIVRQARRVRGSGASARPRPSAPRSAALAFHGYLDLLVPVVLLLRVPAVFAAPWPVLVRTDVGLVVAVLIVVRLTGGGLRLAGWWRLRHGTAPHRAARRRFPPAMVAG